MNKDELVKLDCRSTHEIKTHDPSVKEEDILYHIFTVESGGSKGTIAFMRTWLHLFIQMHKKFFTTLGTKYFKSKGWMEGILAGCKGDVMVLHRLCLLMKKHAWVHLKDGKVWTSLKTPPKLHAMVMDQCNLHLAYLGRGIFTTLIERPEPLDGKAVSTDSSLSANETLTINMLTLAGLSVGLSRPRERRPSATATNTDNTGVGSSTSTTTSAPVSTPILIEPIDASDP